MGKPFLIVVGVVVILAVFAYLLFTDKIGSQPKLEDTITINPANIPAKKSMNDDQGLKIEDIKVGTGPAVKSGDTVTINYVGTLTDGTKFDSSYDHGQPFSTQIGTGQVIKGWDLGVIGMKVGGKRKLTIPPQLGYGSQGTDGIPPNSTLIFELELVGIK